MVSKGNRLKNIVGYDEIITKVVDRSKAARSGSVAKHEDILTIERLIPHDIGKSS